MRLWSHTHLPTHVSHAFVHTHLPTRVSVASPHPRSLAVLRIVPKPGSKLPPPIAVGASHDLSVGQNVLAIGNPFGLDHTLTTGVVSALGREVDGVGGRPIKGCIQVRDVR